MNQTALHIAAKSNYGQLAKLLLSKKSYINAIDNLHRTPLYLAANKNDCELVIVRYI